MPFITLTTDISSSGDTLHRDEGDHDNCCIQFKDVSSPYIGLTLYCIDHSIVYDFKDKQWIKDNKRRKDHYALLDNSFGVDRKSFMVCTTELDTIAINKKVFPLSKDYKMGLKQYPKWKIMCQGYDEHGQATNETFSTDPFVIKSKRPLKIQDEINLKNGLTVVRKKRRRKCNSCQELSHKYQETSNMMLTLESKKNFYEQAYKKAKRDLNALHELVQSHPHTQESNFLKTALRLTQPVENKQTKRF